MSLRRKLKKKNKKLSWQINEENDSNQESLLHASVNFALKKLLRNF